MFVFTEKWIVCCRVLFSALFLVIGGAQFGSAAAAADGDTAPAPPVCEASRIMVGALERSYLLCVPQNLTGAAPLLVAFHGRSMTAAGMQAASGLDRRAGEAGILTAYLNGCDGRGCEGGDWGAGNRHTRDERFVRAAISAIRDAYAIDAERIYATFISSGGTFAYALACGMSDLFAAVTVLSPPQEGGVGQTDAGDGASCVRFTGCEPGRDIAWCAVPDADHLLSPLDSLDASILNGERLIETLLQYAKADVPVSAFDRAEAPLQASVPSRPITRPAAEERVFEVIVTRSRAARAALAGRRSR